MVARARLEGWELASRQVSYYVHPVVADPRGPAAGPYLRRGGPPPAGVMHPLVAYVYGTRGGRLDRR